MTKCQTGECPRDAIMAIHTLAPKGKSLVHKVFQDEADAPKKAVRYCGQHGISVAAQLAALTDSSLAVKVDVEERP